MSASDQHVTVRYVVDDVQASLDFYTTHLGFTTGLVVQPAFAEVFRGQLRLLLSGPASSGAKATPSESSSPGRNRIHLQVDDLETEMTRLADAGLELCSDVVSGPGGRQVLIRDPAGNLVEIFEAAAVRP